MLRPTGAASALAEQLSRGFDTDDDELVGYARSGDTEALELLMRRYASFARSKAKTYFLIGADRDDLYQEGMIGLFKAVRDYDPAKTVSFRAFAELCITRQIITAIKGATRQKHAPLNSYVSLHRSAPGGEEGERELLDFLVSAKVIDPVDLVVAEDELREIQKFLTEILSDLEMEVLHRYLEGSSYQEIAADLGRRAKSIDNALQRVKRKLETFLEERERQAERALEAVPTTNGAGSNGAPSHQNGHARSSRSPSRSGDLRASVRFAAAAVARTRRQPAGGGRASPQS